MQKEIRYHFVIIPKKCVDVVLFLPLDITMERDHFFVMITIFVVYALYLQVPVHIVGGCLTLSIWNYPTQSPCVHK